MFFHPDIDAWICNKKLEEIQSSLVIQRTPEGWTYLPYSHQHTQNLALVPDT